MINLSSTRNNIERSLSVNQLKVTHSILTVLAKPLKLYDFVPSWTI